MKICFLCSCLEPGRDGVGDYTRRLAMALKRKGAVVHALALNDRHVGSGDVIAGEVQETREGGLEVWRYSAALPWKERLARVQETINRLEPDFVSLQFVPYGFHVKGLPFSLPRRLAKLKGGFRWHIMFHELWVENSRPGRFSRLALLSGMQKRIILGMLKRLSPILITTSIRHYQERLAPWSTRILPLFGNIGKDYMAESSAELVEFHRYVAKGFLLCTIFGTLPKKQMWPKIHSEVVEVSRKRPVLLCLCGNGGPEACEFSRYMEPNAVPGKLELLQLGKLPEHLIFEILTRSDVGICRVPPKYHGKSGTAIAMAEAGLPVWLPGADVEGISLWIPAERAYPSLVAAVGAGKTGEMSRLDAVAETFEQLLLPQIST